MKHLSVLLLILSFMSAKGIILEERNNLSLSDIGLKDFNCEGTNKLNENSRSFKNFSFDLPNEFTLQHSLSNSNKQVFLNEEKNIAVTIDVGNSPSGYENSPIRAIVPDINQFGLTINQEQKKNFSDFQLLNSTYNKLGNREAILVSQSSTKISGTKNIKMAVKSYFVISTPYFVSITISYPETSVSSRMEVERIIKSFKF